MRIAVFSERGKSGWKANGEKEKSWQNYISSDCTVNFHASVFSVFVFASSLAGLFSREKWHWWKFERNEGRQAKREREKLES